MSVGELIEQTKLLLPQGILSTSFYFSCNSINKSAKSLLEKERKKKKEVHKYFHTETDTRLTQWDWRGCFGLLWLVGGWYSVVFFISILGSDLIALLLAPAFHFIISSPNFLLYYKIVCSVLRNWRIKRGENFSCRLE